ncbi:hypothetical protein [Stieleria varia]|uniref:Uncharacterized protein n=1 Tax=Stieleria varia TaxID=2528005 RepID=A0A5C6ALL1_9BACT|nr:hypothetical protein [Stieleria varia]TWU00915.1 hypothetical protein Pla52n_42850 [Stieleria varia]
MTERTEDNESQQRWGGDIQSPTLLYVKGSLFVLLGITSAGLLLLHSPHWKTAFLLGVCVWSSCRAYYFAFYVIEHYIDDGERYAGLLDFAKRFVRRKR